MYLINKELTHSKFRFFERKLQIICNMATCKFQQSVLSAGQAGEWYAYQSDCFVGIAAVSPSVWFPGWMVFVRSHTPMARKIYLSLGDKEVGVSIEEVYNGG